MNSFAKQGAEGRNYQERLRQYRSKLAHLRAQQRRDRLTLCQHQAMMRKADAIWFAPRGANGRSMPPSLLRRHWSARGMSGEPIAIPAQ